MTSPPPTAKELFLEALELPPPERAAFVRRACGADPELADRVDGLLAAHARADALLEAGMPGALRGNLRAGVLNVARRLGLDPT